MAITSSIRELIYSRDGGRCVYCRRSLTRREATIDHIVPRSRFEVREEADDPENLCLCCKTCNTRKSNLSAREFRAQTNRTNTELIRLEAEKRKAQRRIRALDNEMARSTYAYVAYLRICLGSKRLKGFAEGVAGTVKPRGQFPEKESDQNQE